MNWINDFLRSQSDQGDFGYTLMGTLGLALMVLVVVVSIFMAIMEINQIE